MKHLVLTTLFFLLGSALLTACGGGGGVSPADAAKGIEAMFTGDMDTAGKYFCQEELDKIKGQMDPSMMENVTASASCKESGKNIACDVKMTITVEGADPMEQTVPVVLGVKDGKLCGEVTQ